MNTSSTVVLALSVIACTPWVVLELFSEIADVFLDILNNHYDEIQRIKDENP